MVSGQFGGQGLEGLANMLRKPKAIGVIAIGAFLIFILVALGSDDEPPAPLQTQQAQQQTQQNTLDERREQNALNLFTPTPEA